MGTTRRNLPSERRDKNWIQQVDGSIWILWNFRIVEGSPKSVEDALSEGEVDQLGRECLCVVELVEPAGTRTSR